MSFPNQNLISDYQLRGSNSLITYDISGNPVIVDNFHGIGTQTMVLSYSLGNLIQTENYLNGQKYETNIFSYGTSGISQVTVL